MITKEGSAASAISWTIGGALLVLFLVGLYRVIAPFLEGLVWGIILVLMTWPIYRWLHIKCQLREAMAAFLLTTGIGAILVLTAFPVVTELGGELYSISKEANLAAWVGREKLFLVPELDRIARTLHIDDATVLFMRTLGGLSLDITRSAAQLFLESLANIGMMLFSSYFFFRYGSRLLHQLKSVLSHYTNMNSQRVFALVGDTIKGVFYGAVATALAQGILAGIGFYVAVAPIPVLLGLVTMLMSFVPFGAPVVYVPVSLYLVLGVGEWFAGLGLLIWGVLVVSTIDNILRPLFISQKMKLPLLLVFLGVVGGIFTFGLIGLFIGPVLLALAHSAWRKLVDTSTEMGTTELREML